MSIKNDVKHWRERARVARRQSGDMPDEPTQLAMLEIAQEYDAVAERAVARNAKGSTQGH